MSLPRAVTAVVFDMDGLLVDSESIFRDAMMAVSARQGLDLPMDVFLRMVGLPGPSSRDVALTHFGVAFDHEPWIEAVRQEAHARVEVELTLKAGVLELLDVLKTRAIPTAVCTSSTRRTVELQLGRTDILHRFDAIIAAGDYPRGKPNPDPFLAAAERLDVHPANCLALEDSHNGVRAAHAAGMMTIMVPDLLQATDEMHSLCHAITQTLHDVVAMLELHI